MDKLPNGEELRKILMNVIADAEDDFDDDDSAEAATIEDLAGAIMGYAVLHEINPSEVCMAVCFIVSVMSGLAEVNLNKDN